MLIIKARLKLLLVSNETVLSESNAGAFDVLAFTWGGYNGLAPIAEAGDYDISCAPAGEDGTTPVGPEGPRTTFTVHAAPDANVVATGTASHTASVAVRTVASRASASARNTAMRPCDGVSVIEATRKHAIRVPSGEYEGS